MRKRAARYQAPAEIDRPSSARTSRGFASGNLIQPRFIRKMRRPATSDEYRPLCLFVKTQREPGICATPPAPTCSHLLIAEAATAH